MDIQSSFVCDQEKAILGSNKYKVVQSTLNNVDIRDVANNQTNISKLPFKFNHMLQEKVVPTNQFYSGRCWIFAGLNVLRHKMIQHYKLSDNFELSQAYVFKCDKIERCNTAMEMLYDFIKRGLENTLEFVVFLDTCTDDGGNIAMFMNIVRKYGVVPKDVMPDSMQVKNTAMLNNILKITIKSSLDKINKHMSRSDFNKLKRSVLEDCYRVISLSMGNTPSCFSWNLHDADATKKYTPLAFYNKVVKSVINLDDYVCVVNDPRHAYGSLLVVEYGHNVLNVNDSDLRKKITNLYLNIDITTLKTAVFKTIDSKKAPVWFGTDYGVYVLNDNSILDQHSSTIQDIFDVKILNSKKVAMNNRTTCPNHAMIITGCQKEGKQFTRWKVENSHGDKSTLKGFLTMSDDYFNDFVICAFVHKSTLPTKLRTLYKECKHVTWLPFWDVIGNFT